MKKIKDTNFLKESRKITKEKEITKEIVKGFPRCHQNSSMVKIPTIILLIYGIQSIDILEGNGAGHKVMNRKGRRLHLDVPLNSPLYLLT